ncbi:Transcription termination factor 2 [Tetrabaena socialis]|uniref:Transcription termination factor 2 n=1 Tax=Tetrabaena socialis TaxID=47790 RepID=A0A2J8AIX8_9CHLO|nr:Transcription termination factor 2 [Tetrabaena socialis]|eukprot:PNH12465.1 Transcription termination factor 2 [Tetrabaena socialis]
MAPPSSPPPALLPCLPRAPQLAWHRLVLDEAQMVGGGLSNVALMAARISATRRWCVTGTPIGKGGLNDVYGLIKVLQYKPYDNLDVFRRLVSAPYRSGSLEGHQRLAALVKPVMWRTSKAVAAQDHPLPRRVLQEAHLRFPAGEETFYEVVKDGLRAVCVELSTHQSEQQQQQQQQEQEEEQQRQQQQRQQQRQQQQGHQQQQDKGRGGDDGVIDLTADDMCGPSTSAGAAGGASQGQQQPPAGPALKRRRPKAAGGGTADGKRAAKAARTAVVSSPGALGAQGAAAAGGGAGGSGAAEAVPAFKYNASGKSAAAMSSDAAGMRAASHEMLQMSWQVGENGIEAAAAAEGAATAAVAMGEFTADIKAAGASIRSWRFVQAHTSQMLADLLTAHPEVMAAPPPGAAAAAAGTAAAAGSTPAAAGTTAGPSADPASPPAGPRLASPAAAAAAADATGSGDAAARAARLRAHVASRVDDVRATADVELQRARGRLQGVRGRIERLKGQVVEDYDQAVSRGLPQGVLPEPHGWLEDVRARLEAARLVEAQQREEKQAAAGAGATVSLMGKEVVALLSEEEASVQRLRVGLDAAAGALLVAAALERLRAAERGLGAQQQQQQAAAAVAEGGGGPEWRSLLVGGVNVSVPPEGVTAVAQDPRLSARAGWSLSYPAPVGLLRQALSARTEAAPVEGAARGIAHGCDLLTVLLCERYLRPPLRMLQSRLEEQHKTAESRNTSYLRSHGLGVLLPTLEAVRRRTELLRAWKDANTAELQVELAADQCEVLTEEVTAAAQGRVAGMAPLLRLAEEDLRARIKELQVRANHVFLLEPSTDPAIEQQAVARVHRIGQTRDVWVTRLIVDNTVETRILRMLKEKQQLFMEASSAGAGAGPSTAAAAAATAPGGLAPGLVPLLQGGEGEEASLPSAAPRQEVLARADLRYLLDAVLE